MAKDKPAPAKAEEPTPAETPSLPTIPPVVVTPEEGKEAAEHARVTQIRAVAKEGWEAFVAAEPDAANRLVGGFDGSHFETLDILHKNGLYAMVQSIIEDPHGETWASVMPANHDRKAIRALDNAFRAALGYSAYRHEGE